MKPPWSLWALSLVVRPTVAPRCLNEGNLLLLRLSFLFCLAGTMHYTHQSYSCLQSVYQWELSENQQKTFSKIKYIKKEPNDMGGVQSSQVLQPCGGHPQMRGWSQWQRFSPGSKRSKPHLRLPSLGVQFWETPRTSGFEGQKSWKTQSLHTWRAHTKSHTLQVLA